ncbi:DUF6520 family protein [Algoriphagus sp. D3-2-R+10]|uniref:DUF6520 family protein n=1 Tax=Algoriphagus aurantiacus TaxID=3103948 RepID=UPI002B38F519|nr:DUF6520 family protein [Algoriphagus sp. D3-2-R+10]MEB2778592.1 DUF6520 family protein [Algoriphagus sp. D3-2-R+10]
MNKLLKFLPAFALILASGLAVAVNLPAAIDNPPSKIWTPDVEEDSGYREITSEILGTNYQCNSGGLECRVQFHNDNPMTGNKSVLTAGTYNPL